MAIDAWLPVGFALPDSAHVRVGLHGGDGCQVFATDGEGTALVAKTALADRWVQARLVEPDVLKPLVVGDMRWSPSRALPRTSLRR